MSHPLAPFSCSIFYIPAQLSTSPICYNPSIPSYRTFLSELARANHWPLQIDHDSDLDLGELLRLLDHLYKHLVFLVLYSAHVDAEDVRALLNQLTDCFLIRNQ